MTEDSSGYLEPARVLVQGHGFSEWDGAAGGYRPCLTRTPLYSLYLAFFYRLLGESGLWLSLWGQRLLWMLGVLFLFPPAKSGGDFRARFGIFAGKAILLLSPETLLTSSYYLTDMLHAFWVLLGLYYLLMTPRRYALSGFLFSLAILTRPISLLLPMVLSCAFFVRWIMSGTPSLRPMVVFLLAAYLLPGAWMARNYRYSGHFCLSPLLGYNLTLHNLEDVKELEQHDVWLSDNQKQFLLSLRQTNSVPFALNTLVRRQRMTRFEADLTALGVAVKAIALHPLHYMANSLHSAVNIVLSPANDLELLRLISGGRVQPSVTLRQAFTEGKWFHLGVHVALRLFNAGLFVIYPLFVLVWLYKKRAYDFGAVLMLSSAVYFIVFTAAMIPSHDRYLLPIFPAILYFYCGGRFGYNVNAY